MEIPCLVKTLTWNVNGTLLNTPELIDRVNQVVKQLLNSVDYTQTCVAIGLQEVVKVGKLVNRQQKSMKLQHLWHDVLQNAICDTMKGRQVTSLGSHAHKTGIAMHVFRIESLQPSIGLQEDHDIHLVKHGMSKGSLAVSLRNQNGAHVTLVVSHLPAYARNVFFRQDKSTKGKMAAFDERNQALQQDLHNLSLCKKGHEQVIWMGDLNYRCVDSANPKHDVQHAFECLPSLWNVQLQDCFVKYDELYNNLKRVFPDFHETIVEFPPTYKLGSAHKERVYAWTDRILYKNSNGTLSVVPGTYQALHPHGWMDVLSDHAPVMQAFLLLAPTTRTSSASWCK